MNSRIGKDNDYCLFFEDLTIFLLKSKENVKSLEWLSFYDQFYFSFSLKEMEEHMRSMLHHRELENLKGRYENRSES